MADHKDRLDALVENAELLIHYNTQAQVLPSSKLETALQNYKKLKNPDFNSQGAMTLRTEVARMTKVIKPATIAELRDFYPYTATAAGAARPGWFHRASQRVFLWSFIAFAVYLFLLCASYTVWSNRASIFLTDVQAEATRLSEAGLNNILKSWETVPVIAEMSASQAAAEQLSNTTEDFRVLLSYLQKFEQLSGRQLQLQQNAPMPWKPMPALQGKPLERATDSNSEADTEDGLTAERIWAWIFGSKRASTYVIPQYTSDGQRMGGLGVAPPANAAPTPPGDDGQAEDEQMVNNQNSYKNERDCLTQLETDVNTYLQALAQHEDAVDELAQASGIRALEAIEQPVAGGSNQAANPAPIAQRQTGGMITLKAAVLSARAREINMNAFNCIYNVPGGDNARFENIGLKYETTLRTFRDKVDARNSWALPGLYGALGAVLLTLRVMVNPAIPSPAPSRTAIRVVLGALVGVIIGWFWSPKSDDFFEVANISVGLFTIAFLFGYGIDVFFGILERVILSISDLFDRPLSPS